MRALVKQVEVGEDSIRVIYKVAPLPFERGPKGGRSQDCGRGGRGALRAASSLVLVACCSTLASLFVAESDRHFQPLLEQVQEVSITEATAHRLHQLGVRDAVERLSNMMPRSRTHLRLIPKISR